MGEILNMVLDSIWFILPLYVANMVPVFIKNMKFLSAPIDFGRKIKGKRIFGDHKTWRGLIFGTLVGGILSYLQFRGFLVGIVLGFGGLLGDLIKSFFKRRLNIPEGGKLILFDQLDFLIGGLFFCYIFRLLYLEINQIVFLFIATYILSLLCSYIGYKIGLKENPW